METHDARLVTPFSMVLSGPPGSGKSQFIVNMLTRANQIMTKKPDYVVYCHGTVTSDDFRRGLVNEFRQGVPSYEDIQTLTRRYKHGNGCMIIIDDLLDAVETPVVRDLFTKISRHDNVSVIFVTQNTFLKSPNYRTISLNTNYYVFFRNFRDRTPLRAFAQQYMPDNSKFILDVYNDVMKTPYGHLLIDLRQQTDNRLRVRSNALEEPITVYLPAPRYK